jgi:hypothetical protein
MKQILTIHDFSFNHTHRKQSDTSNQVYLPAAVPLHLILRRLQCSVPPFCSALFTIKIVSCRGAPLAV